MDENPPLGGFLAKLSVPLQVSERQLSSDVYHAYAFVVLHLAVLLRVWKILRIVM